MNYSETIDKVKKYSYLKKSVAKFREDKYLILEVFPLPANSNNLAYILNKMKSGESFSESWIKTESNADFQVGVKCMGLESQNIVLLRLKDIEY